MSTLRTAAIRLAASSTPEVRTALLPVLSKTAALVDNSAPGVFIGSGFIEGVDLSLYWDAPETLWSQIGVSTSTPGASRIEARVSSIVRGPQHLDEVLAGIKKFAALNPVLRKAGARFFKKFAFHKPYAVGLDSANLARALGF